ncbi:FAD binding domain-containing protein [Stackebrandtia sp.]|uniref:FAD binding domain-containing protein n=1 Tax=Stackebrandtia sp. TaxID=2023065 RepID=UPI0032C2365F
MDFHSPTTLDEAVEIKAAHPDAMPIAGGTDVMVELNFDVHRPAALLDLNRVAELAEWDGDDARVRIGAGVPYVRIINEIGPILPGLAIASRTVGSPQIRNRGTLGGNLGAASPAGDGHPVLMASNATVEIASACGRRDVAIADFFTGVKRNCLAEDELITAIRVPRIEGSQQFSKIGTRNAMVIAVCALGLVLDAARRRVGTGIGSAAPTPVRAPEAEEFLAAELDWDKRGPLPEPVARRFGELVAAAARPIDDVRGSADYRRHALSVMARRTLGWAWKELRCA